MTHKALTVLFVSCLTGLPLTRCTSTVGAGQIRAEKAISGVQRALKLINDSDLSPEIKKLVQAELVPVSQEIKQLGQDVDHNKEIADSNKSAAAYWRWTLLIGGILILAGGALGIRKLVS